MKSTSIASRVGRWALLAVLIGYATLHRPGQTYGSTSLERRTAMPGDDIVAKPHGVKRRAERLALIGA